MAADRVLVASVVLMVAWGALAFGAVYPWAWEPLLAAAVVAGSLGLWVGRGTRWPAVPTLVALSAVGVVAALQLVPLPAGMLGRLSPGTVELLRQYDFRWLVAADPAAAGLTHPMSVAPDRTLVGLAFLVTLGLLLAGLSRGLSRGGAVGLVAVLIGFGLVLALIGIVQRAFMPKEMVFAKVYGFWTPEGKGNIFGPYVNRNHFAGWMLMALPLGLGYVSALVEHGLQDVRRTWRDRIIWLGSPSGGRVLLTTFALAVMGLSVVLSNSRSGMAGLAVALLVSGAVAVSQQQSRRRRAVVATLFVLIGAGAVVWAGLDIAARRFSTVSTEVGWRLEAWRVALAIARDFPWFGSGLNTFGVAAGLYERRELGVHFQEAHNDYLQLAAEGGLVMAIPLVAAVCLTAIELWRRITEGQPRLLYWLRIGALAGLVAIALQSAVEFSLQMPGNAVLFVVVLAIALHRGEPGAYEVPAGERPAARRTRARTGRDDYDYGFGSRRGWR